MLFKVEIESAKSVKAIPEDGLTIAESQTTSDIGATFVPVTIVMEQGSTTVKIKLDGEMRPEKPD